MTFFWQYLRFHRRTLVLLAVCSGIFVASFRLYHLPMLTVLYPVLLCALLGMVFLVVDFLRTKQIHQALGRIQTITDEKAAHFPVPQTVIEEDYRELLHRFCVEHDSWLQQTEKRRDELVDYYTTWGHQIKTPTTSMRLHLTQLQQQNEDTPLSRQLAIDLCHVEQYVDMVLTYLRLTGDSTDYVFREQELDTIVKGAVRRLSQEFILRKLRLEYTPLSTTVVTDAKWLGFVIEQVLTNALKYTPDGTITIWLDQSGGRKLLCIRDTGIGIASEDLPRIFEPGFTGKIGRQNERATGLGLYLCRRICQNLGHSISATSVVDKGTCITIDLTQKDRS